MSRAGDWCYLGSRARIPPGLQSLAYKFRDSPPVFRDHFPPGEAAEHGEGDSSETEAGVPDSGAVSRRVASDRNVFLRKGLCTVRLRPAVIHLLVGFVDGHPE